MSNEFPSPFLELCGASGPLELSVDSGEEGSRTFWSLNQPYALIGRQADCDIPLAHQDVGSRHAYLQVLQGHVYGIDLGSRGGTVWPGGPSPGVWLRCDDRFRIGPFTLRLTSGSKADPPGGDPRKAGFSPAGPWHPCLEISHPSLPSHSWVMNRAIALVGRAEICKVRLGSDSVSRIHCSLVRYAGELIAVDLCGRGGIRLNGTPVRHTLLRAGDCLQVGEFTLRIASDAGGAPEQRGVVPVTTFPVELLPPTLPCVNMNLQNSMLVSPATADAQLAQTVLIPLVQQFSLMQEQMFHQFRQTLVLMMQMFKSCRDDQVASINEELAQLQRVTRELAELQTQLARPRSLTPPQLPEPAATNGIDHVPGIPPTPEPYTPTPVATPSDDLHLHLCQRMEALEKERSGHWQNLVRFFSWK